MVKPNLWIGTQPNPDDRLKIFVSIRDRDRFDTLPAGPSSAKIRVTDLNTGKRYTIRRGPCGLGCYCAAELAHGR